MKKSRDVSIDGNVPLTKPIVFGIECFSRACEKHGKNSYGLTLMQDAAIAAQGYSWKAGASSYSISAADDAGFMYALIDLSDEIRHCAGMEAVPGDKDCSPYLQKRGIKINIPLDARTPSYSDASDSALLNTENVWNEAFWEEYLDELAIRKYNVLTLWSLFPFPSMVKVPEYPGTSLEDVKISSIFPKPDMSGWDMFTPDMAGRLITVKKLTIEDKIAFWKKILAYAQERCIEVYMFTWNLFAYGLEGNPYGITADQENPETRRYLYCAVKSLLETYDMLAGIGITSGEHMSGDTQVDIRFLRETYGRAVEDFQHEHPGRSVRFIHRMQYANYPVIKSCYKDFTGVFNLSFKYSQAHMHAASVPSFLRKFLEENTVDAKIWLTVRDDDYYLHRWGNYEFARNYLAGFPVDSVLGFYIGADGYTWAMDYSGRRGAPQLYIRKMWYKTALFGQLAYNMDKERTYFEREARHRLGVADTQFFDQWEKASMLLGMVTCVHWHDYDFQWYPEGCCKFIHPPVGKLAFEDIIDFIECGSQPDSGYLSVQDYCSAVVEEKPLQGITPLDVCRKLHADSSSVIDYVESLVRRECLEGEARETLEDMRDLAILGLYYACKIEAAVFLQMMRLSHPVAGSADKIRGLMKQAAGLWKRYSGETDRRYIPQRFSRLCSYIDFRQFSVSADLDIVMAADIIAQRQEGEHHAVVE